MKILSNHSCLALDDPSAFSRFADFELKVFGCPPADDFPYDYIQDFDGFYEKVIAPVYSPDFILFYWPEYLPMPPNFHRVPLPKFAVVSDWNVGVNFLPFVLPLFHGVFCDKNGVEIIKRMGCERVAHWQQYAASWGRDTVLPQENRVYDIGFIGNLNINLQRGREKWLKRIACLGGGYKVGIWGSVYGEEYAKTLNRCKIVFNRSIRGEMNLRSWEAPACGALLFMEEENDEIRDYFEPGREVVLYNEGNFEGLLDYYLTHQEEREAIVNACFKKLEEHRFALRFSQLLEQVTAWMAHQKPAPAKPPCANLAYAFFQPAIQSKNKLLLDGIDEGEPRWEAERHLCVYAHRVWNRIRLDQPEYAAVLNRAYSLQIKVFPDDLISYLNYGNLLIGEEKWVEAIGVFTTGLEAMSNALELRKQLTGFLHQAEVDFEKGLWLLACVDVYRGGMDTTPLFDFFRARFLFHSGACLFRLDHLEMALECVQNALQCRRDMTDAWLMAGEIRCGQSDFARAADCFLEAAECSPLNLQTYVSAANCFNRLNMNQRAAAVMAEAKTIRQNIQNLSCYDDALAEYDRGDRTR